MCGTDFSCGSKHLSPTLGLVLLGRHESGEREPILQRPHHQQQHEAVEERQKGERNEGHALVGVLVEEAAEGRRRQAAEGDEGERDAERLCKN